MEYFDRGLLPCNFEVVREFNAMILMLNWSFPQPTIHIRGKNIRVDVATINDTLRVPNPSNVPFKAKVDKANLKWLEQILVPWG